MDNALATANCFVKVGVWMIMIMIMIINRETAL